MQGTANSLKHMTPNTDDSCGKYPLTYNKRSRKHGYSEARASNAIPVMDTYCAMDAKIQWARVPLLIVRWIDCFICRGFRIARASTS